MGVVRDVAPEIDGLEGTFAEKSAVKAGSVVMSIAYGYRFSRVGNGQQSKPRASVEGIIANGRY